MHLSSLLGLLCTLTGLQAATPSKDSVLASYAAAIGADRIAKLHSVVDTHVLHSQSSEIIVVSYAKRPLKFRSEVSGPRGRVITGYDGTKAWRVVENRGEEPKHIALDAGAVNSLHKQAVALLDGWLLDAQARGLPIELVGEVSSEEQPLTLSVTETDHSIYRVKLDPKTFLPLSFHTTLNGRSCQYRFSNYMSAEGILVPIEIRTLFDGVEVQDSRLCSIRFDVELEDAFFAEPPTTARPAAPTNGLAPSPLVASAQEGNRGEFHP